MNYFLAAMVGMTTDRLFETRLEIFIMVILPKRVSFLADQLFRILWSLSIFSEKLTCAGVSFAHNIGFEEGRVISILLIDFCGDLRISCNSWFYFLFDMIWMSLDMICISKRAISFHQPISIKAYGITLTIADNLEPWLRLINTFLYRHECFTGKYTTRKIHKNYIRDPSGLFSIISHVSLSMT